MEMKGLALSLGLGAAAGAVAVMMLPRKSPARKLATQAAHKVEDAAWKVSDKLTQELGM